jgi:hypothetical protein
MYHLYEGVYVMKTKKQLSIKGFFLPAIALCSLLLSGNAAHADLVTYAFTGSVSQVNSPLTGSFISGTPMSGKFEFDNSPATGGTYGNVVTGLTMNIGGYTAQYGAGANAVSISKNIDLGDGFFGDRWQLVTAATAAAPSGAINGTYSPIRFDLNLDREGNLFANTDMQNPPSLGGVLPLTSTRWRLVFENASGNMVRVQGALASLTAVPLPAAVILFGAGLISLVGLGAGGLRNLRWPQA